MLIPHETEPTPKVTGNDEENGQSPTDQQQEGRYRISKRPMYDSSDCDDDEHSKQMAVPSKLQMDSEDTKCSKGIFGNISVAVFLIQSPSFSDLKRSVSCSAQ